ncbi:hypothetical protein BKA63DRAFT_1569 [Paraphoma chrysanthemicola]|nr:hypothetical protein BKA63DRAFT_1569 [Paraphoma chrysanthemicola]
MAYARTLVSKGRLILSSTTTLQPARLARLSAPYIYRRSAPRQRHFAVHAKSCEEADGRIPGTPSDSPNAIDAHLSNNHSRSIGVLNLPTAASKPAVDAWLQSNGFQAVRLQMRLDRFSFENDKRCFVELATEDEAKRALQYLNRTLFMEQEILVTPMKKAFIWGPEREAHSILATRFFYPDILSPKAALAPLIEGRRIQLRVQPPGWKRPDGSDTLRKAIARVIEENFADFGIEAVSKLIPFSGPSEATKYLCSIDFTTKSGADEAIDRFNDAEIEGRKVQLQRASLSTGFARQIGKIDPSLLIMLPDDVHAKAAIVEQRSHAETTREDQHPQRFSMRGKTRRTFFD